MSENTTAVDTGDSRVSTATDTPDDTSETMPPTSTTNDEVDVEQEAPAAESDTAESRSSTDDDLERDTTDSSSAARDVAKYRKRAQAAEKDRDSLAERLTALQRGEAERLAASKLGDGADLWAAGTELDSLLDDDGNLSPDLVDQAARSVIEAHPHWRKLAPPAPPASTVTANDKIGADGKPSFIDAFAPRK